MTAVPGASSRLTQVALPAVLVVLAALSVGYWHMQQDDSYIFYSYARNIAEGHGYVFNLGEKVNATTSPLYTLFLAAVYTALGWLPLATLPAIGFAIGMVSLLLLCRFLFACVQDMQGSLAPVVLPLVFLTIPLLSNAIGMELFLAMMLAIGSLSVYLRGRMKAAAVLSTLAVLARPDMLILPGLLFAHCVVTRHRPPRLAPTLLFVGPLTAWLIFSWFYFGNLLPSTVGAKLMQADAELWGFGPVYLKGLFSTSNWFPGWITGTQALPLVGLLCVVAAGVLVGLFLLVTRFGRWPFLRHPALLILIAWSLLHLIAYGVVLDAPAYEWYYAPLAPGTAALMTIPIEALLRSTRVDLRPDSTRPIFIVIVPLTLLGLWLPLSSIGYRASLEYESHRAAALWLNDHAHDGASVGSGDIDILRYFYTKGPVVDGMGLVTPAAVEHVRNRDFGWYIREYRPDYLMLPHPPRRTTEGFTESDWFRNSYTRRTTIGSQELGSAVDIFERIP